MRFDIVESLQEFSSVEFNALDGAAGSAGSYARLIQRESDRRVECRYVRISDGNQILGAVPFYLPRTKRLPAQYDPTEWRSETSLADPVSKPLWVGGSADLRSCLHLASSARHWEVVKEAVRLVGSFAEPRQISVLCFPYFSEREMSLLTNAVPECAWLPLGREATFGIPSGGPYTDAQPSRVRYVLRRDARLVADAGVQGWTEPWHRVANAASEMIAEHNRSHGRLDDVRLARLRHEEWLECGGVDLIVFVARTRRLTGYLTARLWGGLLELNELGLPSAAGSDRLAIYLSLMFSQPLAYAVRGGLSEVRAGLKAEVPKASRGARLREISGGVLAL